MQHKIVSQEQWLAARKQFLEKEKEFTRLRDQLSADRRALPWVKVEKNYVFDTPKGKKSLAELFQGRSQLIVYHFMLGPGWEAGCQSCSYLADHFDGADVHLRQRDVTFLAVSRAPLKEIEAFEKRMGWRFDWVSSHGGDFNFDFGVSFEKEAIERGEKLYNYGSLPAEVEEMPGLSAFYKDEKGAVFHTYSTYARGLDILVGAYNLLDMAPKGRDEESLPWTMAWVKHHDKYDEGRQAQAAQR